MSARRTAKEEAEQATIDKRKAEKEAEKEAAEKNQEAEAAKRATRKKAEEEEASAKTDKERRIDNNEAEQEELMDQIKSEFQLSSKHVEEVEPRFFNADDKMPLTGVEHRGGEGMELTSNEPAHPEPSKVQLLYNGRVKYSSSEQIMQEKGQMLGDPQNSLENNSSNKTEMKTDLKVQRVSQVTLSL